MKTTKLSFKNASGVLLSAKLELPVDQKAHNFVLFAHCFTCNKNLNAVHNISHALTKEGFGVLRFDFTGLGESEGDFANTNFSSNIQDLVAAADFLRTAYQAPTLLIGHSLGGAAVLASKQYLPEVKAIATIGAPYQPEHVAHIFEDVKPEIEAKGIARVKIAGRTFSVKKQFLDDISAVKMHQLIQHLEAALLVFHAPQDDVVEIDNATQIFKTAMHPRSFISLDGADHLLSRAEDSLYVGQAIAAWAARYVRIPEEKELNTTHQVVGEIEDTYTMDFKAGKHRLRADEPEAVGGDDLGPDPYGFLLTALGACTGMTLRMYANRKGWDLARVKVHLKHEKIYAQDCEDCTSTEKKIDEITRFIEIEGNLSTEQIQKLMDIADKCPVHRTLHSEIKIRTKSI